MILVLINITAPDPSVGIVCMLGEGYVCEML